MENKKTGPLVTVHISAYNHQYYIGSSIQSVIDQKYENIEFIIINDGSKDNTHEVILEYIDRCKERFVRFQYINRDNKGLSATKNECLNWAEGKYFTGIASDDIMLPNKIEALVGFLEDNNDKYAVAFGDANFMDAEENKINLDSIGHVSPSINKGFNSFLAFYTKDRQINYKDEKVFGSYETLIGGNYLPAMSQVINTELVREVGGWTKGNMVEDWEMWLKLSKKYKFKYIDVPVALYRWHERNSMKINTEQLEIDAMKLLIQEQSYAYDNNLKETWKLNYFYGLLNFVKNKEISLFFTYFKLNLGYSFTLFLIQKIIKKVANLK